PQVGPGHEPHRQVEAPRNLARVVDGHDVRMLDRHRELRLPGEALAEALVERELRRDELERDRALEAEIVGPVHDAHPALADQLLDPVADEVGSDLDLGLRDGTWLSDLLRLQGRELAPETRDVELVQALVAVEALEAVRAQVDDGDPGYPFLEQLPC